MQLPYRRLVIFRYDDLMGSLPTSCPVVERFELGQQRGLEAAKPQHAALVAGIATLHDLNGSSTTR
jgi:hypothetical protein